ncbi:hypothetical protein [Xenorhabdus bovienii]|uniref:hypothetical protein n=1 Tax=Xenorhabdus bovienii TaxID=40576 RepID=UPI0023B2B357|nr:hypothetical protein [Xenorhabdus bovienii]MDE9429120.1 hypothetical protein [Xenorhabdus bovienii]MDE9461940.1 hypothetical protein [Xenorhabdus bovienii]MDE9468941.1 hypothetical protein [Xenorhabdus bovienii]
MTIKFMPLTLLTLTLCLTGCDLLSNIISDTWHSYKNDAEPFSPPQKNQWITVEGIAPPNTKPSLYSIYASNRCLATHNTAGGTLYHLSKYHWSKFNISVDPVTGYFKEKIPLNGGGWCQWWIDNIELALEYTNVSHLMKDAVPRGGAGINVYINGARRPSDMKQFKNIIDYRPTIYPVLRKSFVTGNSNQIGLYAGSSKLIFLELMLQPKKEWGIIYMPTLDETKMPKIIIPEGREPSRVEYPDGKIDLNRDSIDYWKINNTSQWE